MYLTKQCKKLYNLRKTAFFILALFSNIHFKIMCHRNRLETFGFQRDDEVASTPTSQTSFHRIQHQIIFSKNKKNRPRTYSKMSISHD